MEIVLIHMEEALMLKEMLTDTRHDAMRHNHTGSLLLLFSLAALVLYVVLRW